MDEDDLMMNYGDGPVGGLINNDPTAITTSTQDPTAIDPTVVNLSAVDPTAIVTKVRRPQVKLTSGRLLCDDGLPFIMKTAPKRIRISTSKKTPYQNLSNIVQFYQLWAHNLFPKAKFKDFIKLSETLGKHDKALREYRMSLYRREMGINPIGEDTDTTSMDIDNEDNEEPHTINENSQSLFVNQGNIEIPEKSTTTAAIHSSNNLDQEDSDDELYSISTIRSKKHIINDDNENENDSDIQPSASTQIIPEQTFPTEDEFDELITTANTASKSQTTETPNDEKENENENHEDEDALQALNDAYMEETMNNMGDYGF